MNRTTAKDDFADSAPRAVPTGPAPGGFRRRDFLKAAAVASMTVTCGLDAAARTKPPGRRPNILWITMEDTCPQFLGCYGNSAARTPNMDRVAAQGVRFTRAFATAPVCAPSRCSIITGCLPEVLGTGAMRSFYPIPDFIKGFPYYLRQAGYFTSNNMKTDYNIADESRFIREAWNECYGQGGWGTSYGSNSDTFDENSREAGWWHRRPDQPFFSVFNLFNSHQSRTETLPEAWYTHNVLHKLPEPERISPDAITVPPFYRDSPEMRKYLCRVYNSLRLTDWEFGKILDRLEQDALKDDTIIFCFADHGEGIPRAKMSAMPTGFQVPFFIYFPPKYQHLSPWPIGRATDELVSSSEDAAPSVLSLAGVKIPDYMSGRPLLGSQRRAPRSYVWGGRNRIDESPDVSRTVTDGKFFYVRAFMPQLPMVKYDKYQEVADIMRTIRADYSAGRLNDLQASLVQPRQPLEYLFDLTDDPWQIHNLAGDPQHAARLATLRNVLQGHLRDIRDILFMPEYEMARRAGHQTPYQFRQDQKAYQAGHVPENSRCLTPYEFRRDDKIYPFDRILETANLVGTGPTAMDEQIRRLQDHDATVRYWAAVGLDAQAEAVKPLAREILAGLDDPHPSVQMVMAGIACKIFNSDRGRKILIHQALRGDWLASLQAVQTIEYMRDESQPFVPTLRQLLSLRPNGHNDVVPGAGAAAQVTLHFLQGAPLYYTSLARWTSAAHLQPDSSVHF